MSNINSLSGLLSDLIALQENSNNILAKLSESYTTSDSFVEVTIFDGTPSGRKVKIPSLTAVMNKLKDVESNINRLTNIDTETSIVLPDGTIRNLILSKIGNTIDPIEMKIPTAFTTKSNWFFEELLTPNLKVDIDIPIEAKGVIIEKYVLSAEEDSLLLFQNRFSNRNDITRNEFLQFCLTANIQYVLDEIEENSAPKKPELYGKFSVIRIFDDIENINGTPTRIQKLELDKLKYNNINFQFLESEELKIGDSLLVEDGTSSTRYEIIYISQFDRVIGVSRKEGYSIIKIGSNVLSYIDSKNTTSKVQISIGFNQHVVIFTKPISSNNIVSSEWSKGITFYSNDLIIQNLDGTTQTLSNFYTNSVVDFGSYLYSMAKDKITPSTLGLTPNVPQLDVNNFKVVSINNHLNDKKTLDDIDELVSEKQRTISYIQTLDASIVAKRNKIFGGTFKSATIEDTEKAQLTKLIDEKNANTILLKSIIDKLDSTLNSQDVSESSPKFRIRGMFPIPEPVFSSRTGAQEVVQFVYRYRYLSKKGTANNPQQFKFKDLDGRDKNGTIPVWIEVKTDVRKRVEDETTGDYTWEVSDVENSEINNINTIDIPIIPGESVEFQIKSVSEAGFPVSPKYSEWSDAIKIDFPEELTPSNRISDLKEQIKNDKNRSDLLELLNSQNVITHVSDGFSNQGKQFLHSANSIASGFFEGQTPLNLYEKILELDNELKRLKAIIEKAVGKLVIKIVDESGNETKVSNNTKVSLFAGNYKDEIKSLSVKKGAIVTKTYFLKIENEAATDLELYARLYGSRQLKVKPSYNISGFDANDIDYNTTRRYDLLPLSLRNPNIDEVLNNIHVNFAPFASSQVKGSFVYCRYKAIDGISSLVSDFDDTNQKFLNPSSNLVNAMEDIENFYDSVWTASLPTGDINSDFIWKGVDATQVINTNNALNILNSFDNSILVHKDHPSIPNWFANFGTNGFANIGDYSKSSVRQTKYSTLTADNINGKKGVGYFENIDFTNNIRTPKLGFDENDVYLIGPRSCGSYLFFAPNDTNVISVNGADSLSKKIVKFGSSSSLSFPIIFQYRMTDYFGFGSTGIGKIGGDPSDSIVSLEYSKIIGIDVYSGDNEKFSFDLEVSSKYSSRSFTTADVPTRTFQNSIDDLNNTINLTNN
jgi:hypothetical protein